jgi:hypothetical protein
LRSAWNIKKKHSERRNKDTFMRNNNVSAIRKIGESLLESKKLTKNEYKHLALECVCGWGGAHKQLVENNIKVICTEKILNVINC